jgi:hypothetical protein
MKKADLDDLEAVAFLLSVSIFYGFVFLIMMNLCGVP